MDLIVGYVIKNLVVEANFVEFRDSRNFTFFEATGVGQHMESHVGEKPMGGEKPQIFSLIFKRCSSRLDLRNSLQI